MYDQDGNDYNSYLSPCSFLRLLDEPRQENIAENIFPIWVNTADMHRPKAEKIDVRHFPIAEKAVPKHLPIGVQIAEHSLAIALQIGPKQAFQIATKQLPIREQNCPIFSHR